MYGISNCNVVLRNRKCICEFFNSRSGRKVLWNWKNKIDEIYGEDSIEVLYLEDRQMNSKIIYKEEGGWKCTSHSEIKCLYNRADFKKDNTIVVRECTITGELYISVICGKKDNKDFQISDTQNTIFTKKEFVNKKWRTDKL